MIVLIDLEHERLRSDTTLWRYFAAKTLETKYRLEEISGEHCLILDYRRATPSALDELNPRAVVVGGNYTGFQHFDENDLAGLKRFLVQGSRPTLAICGGFQLLVQVYGGTVGPMAPEFMEAKDGLSDTDTPFPPELLSPDQAIESSTGADERGFTPVRVIGRHRLFHGLPDAPVFYQLHGGEVKRLPDFFSVLAESEFCKIQAVTHKHAPVFGTQFHPELFDKARSDGRRLLENFFSLAGIQR